MKKSTFNIFIFSLSIVLLSCENNSINSIGIAQKTIQISYKLLNLENLSDTIFNEGENFVFSLSLINTNEHDAYLKQYSIDTAELFKLYRIDDQQELIAIGKPYKTVFCDKIGGISIPANDTLKIQIPWMPEQPWEPGVPYYSTNFCIIKKNAPLPAGNYVTKLRSSFEISINGKTYNTKELSFKINLEIH